MGVGTAEIALSRSVFLVEFHGGPEIFDDNQGCRSPQHQVVSECEDSNKAAYGTDDYQPLPDHAAKLDHAAEDFGKLPLESIETVLVS